MNSETTMTEVTLYHCVSARSFRVLWALEELGLDYRLVTMAFPPRLHDKAFFQINPLGTVPALVDGNGVLTESAAICEYLSQVYGGGALSVNKGEADYGQYLNWLSAADATLTFPQTLILRYAYFESSERRQPQVVEDYTRWFLGRLRGVENALQAGNQYLCQNRFSNADIAVGYALLLADFLGLRPQFQRLTEAFWQRLQERAAFVSALAAENRDARFHGIDPLPTPLIRC
nr:glutathione S-transferase family protein [Stutzerimonas stutzeri]